MVDDVGCCSRDEEGLSPDTTWEGARGHFPGPSSVLPSVGTERLDVLETAADLELRLGAQLL